MLIKRLIKRDIEVDLLVLQIGVVHKTLLTMKMINIVAKMNRS